MAALSRHETDLKLALENCSFKDQESQMLLQSVFGGESTMGGARRSLCVDKLTFENSAARFARPSFQELHGNDEY